MEKSRRPLFILFNKTSRESALHAYCTVTLAQSDIKLRCLPHSLSGPAVWLPFPSLPLSPLPFPPLPFTPTPVSVVGKLVGARRVY